jgi:hypothetical protein
MEFQNIIPFIVLGIYILSLFGKRKAANKDTPGQEKSALKSIIQTIAKQLKDHAEATRRNEERKQRPEQEFVQRALPKTNAVIENDKDEEIEIDLPIEDHFALDEKDEILEEVLLDVPVTKIEGKENQEGILFQPSISVKNLQEAVVWSEILGPPVAFREDHRKLL